MSLHSKPPPPADVERVTTRTLSEMKEEDVPIAMLTAYDFTSARIMDKAGIDVVLVGDSASNVIAGNETTLPMTMDQMIYHAQCVKRGVERAMVLVDLPFGSYQGDSQKALYSGIRMMKEAGVHGIKMEGGESVLPEVKAILSSGIPVMGHLGLTPQSIYQFGSYKVRATDEEEADKLRRDARRLEEVGCFAVVLEKIPAVLAREVTESLSIPTIGIGAGPHCNGQVLVSHDMLGLTTDFNPRFVRRYAHMAETMGQAVQEYVEDVRQRSFPDEEESY